MTEQHVARPAFDQPPGELECAVCVSFIDPDQNAIHEPWPCQEWLLARVRALEAGLQTIADDDNWMYDDNDAHRRWNSYGPDPQQIASALLAGERA